MAKKNDRGRPRFLYVLISFPSDHEVDIGIPTECDVVRAILTNGQYGTRLKSIVTSSVASFHKVPWPKYEKARYVHVAGHASKKGIGLISGSINWEQLAEKLRIVAPRLEGNQKRDLCLSCCHSEDGLTKMRQHLQGHFTGCYYFNDKQIEFDRTITIWSMFYWKKTSETKKGACKRIQKFFGDEILKHEDI